MAQINIAGTLHNTEEIQGDALNSHVVVKSDEVLDETQEKKQSEVNASLIERFGDVDEELDLLSTQVGALTEQNFESYTATSETTSVTQVLPATGEADTIYRVGSWNGTAFDDSMYSEYAWSGSNYVLLAVRSGNGDGVFDISQANASGGNPATYDNLAAAISGTNVPVGVRAGGMSVKYIENVYADYGVVVTEGLTEQPTGTELQSAPSITDGVYKASQLSVFAPLPSTIGTSNTYYIAVTGDTTTYKKWEVKAINGNSTKYVQYLLNTQTWSYNASDWESIDTTFGNRLLIDLSYYVSGGAIRINWNEWILDSSYLMTDYIEIDNRFDVIVSGLSSATAVALVAFYDENKNFISSVYNIGTDGKEYTVNVPYFTRYCRASSKSNITNTYIKQGPAKVTEITKKLFDQSTEINVIKKVKIYEYGLQKGKVLKSHFYLTTDYIPVTDNAKYKFKGILPTSHRDINLIACYSDKSDWAYLGGIITEGIDISFDGDYTPVAGTKYIRICGRAYNSTQPTLKLLYDMYFMLSPIQEIVLDTTEQLPINGKIDVLLPEYFDIAKNLQCDFFLQDAIINPANALTVIDLPQSKVMAGDSGHYRITTTSDGILSIKTYTDLFLDRMLDAKEINVRCNDRTGGSGTKNVLVIGDSLVENGPTASEMFALVSEDGDVTVNSIGTMSQIYNDITYHHEGHSGRSWLWFNSSESPFYFNDSISFTSYMNTYFDGETLDCVFILLGTNDNIGDIESNSKSLIDALVRDYPNCKVAVGLIAKGCTNFKTGTFSMKADSVNKLYLTLYDNGKYSPNVTCVAQGIWIDRFNDYPYNDVQVTPYNSTNTIREFTNQIHPVKSGYQQWGRALYCKLRAWIAGEL